MFLYKIVHSFSVFQSKNYLSLGVRRISENNMDFDLSAKINELICEWNENLKCNMNNRISPQYQRLLLHVSEFLWIRKYFVNFLFLDEKVIVAWDEDTHLESYRVIIDLQMRTWYNTKFSSEKVFYLKFSL